MLTTVAPESGWNKNHRPVRAFEIRGTLPYFRNPSESGQALLQGDFGSQAGRARGYLPQVSPLISTFPMKSLFLSKNAKAATEIQN